MELQVQSDSWWHSGCAITDRVEWKVLDKLEGVESSCMNITVQETILYTGGGHVRTNVNWMKVTDIFYFIPLL